MSFVLISPEFVANAAGDLTGIGSGINAANAAAASSTTQVLAAGADEVSAQIAALFGVHGQQYQMLSAQAAAFHEQFVRTLSGAAGSYLSAEASSAESVVLDLINAPTELLLGRPLVGDGVSATTPGGNGGDGGRKKRQKRAKNVLNFISYVPPAPAPSRKKNLHTAPRLLAW